MRLLANENIGRSVVDALRADGHDVLWAGEAMAGAADPEVLERAINEGRALVTKDKDFGELAARSPRGHAGVILLRLADDRPAATVAVLRRALDAMASAAGSFIVASEAGLRVRRPF